MPSECELTLIFECKEKTATIMLVGITVLSQLGGQAPGISASKLRVHLHSL